MPQLDPTSFPSQLFWLTVSFVVLYVLLARFLLPRIAAVLAGRTQTITGDLDEAARLQREAQAARAAYDATLAESRARAQAMLAEAQAALATRAAARQAELDRDIKKRLAGAGESIRAAKSAVMGKLTPVSGELASLIVETLVHHKPNSKDVGAAVSEIAKERQP